MIRTVTFVSFLLFGLFLKEINTSNNQRTDEFIKEINSAQSEWLAEENEFSTKETLELKQLMGFRKAPTEKLKNYYNHNIVVPDNIPENFDSREKWYKCASISSIKDQSNCGSCWAVSSASAMSDRLCIASKYKVHVNLSAEALMTCCKACTDGEPGCEGGYLDEAWKYFKTHGLVTGGDYGSNEGCQPYGIPPCNTCPSIAETPACRKNSCTNKHYKKKYKKDLHKGKNYYAIPQNVTLIQADILAHGPIITGFEVFADFMHYKSGIYSHVRGGFLGNHAVRILGWGVEKKIPYWLVANSWNRTWGDNGFFKIRRGRNECTFEENAFAGIPKSK